MFSYIPDLYHHMPVAPTPLVTTINISDFARCFLGAKASVLETTGIEQLRKVEAGPDMTWKVHCNVF